MAALVAAPAGAQQPKNAIFDWNHRSFSGDVPASIIPVAHPGHDYTANAGVYTQNFFPTAFNNNRPLSLMLRDTTAPLCGFGDTGALDSVLNYLDVPLTYVFADIEDTSCATNDVLATAQKVRQHPVHSNAYVGAYAWFPGPNDPAQHWPGNQNRQQKHQQYLQSGLNVAMPNCYPYAYFSVHADPVFWGVNRSPNIRAAIFWAPLERFSVAKRHLPQGHMLVPWISGYGPWYGYPYQAPPLRDMRALVKHMRLRGADGYYTLCSGFEREQEPDWWEIPSLPPTWRDYDFRQYRVDMLATWKSLDPVFKGKKPRILNLKTDKARGVQSSGVVFGKKWDKAMILISNHHQHSAVRVRLPKIKGLPKFVDVPCSGSGKEHFQKVYDVRGVGATTALPAWNNHRRGDVNGDQKVNNADVQIIIESYGTCPTPRCYKACPADLNFDGVVDTDDLMIALNNWTG